MSRQGKRLYPEGSKGKCSLFVHDRRFHLSAVGTSTTTLFRRSQVKEVLDMVETFCGEDHNCTAELILDLRDNS